MITFVGWARRARSSRSSDMQVDRLCPPTITSSGRVSSWFGIGAPRNTPTQVVDKLNAEINAGLATPKLKAHLTDLGETPLMGSPTAFGKLIVEETEKWGKVIRTPNIKPERLIRGLR